jgi:hypothetical protein
MTRFFFMEQTTQVLIALLDKEQDGTSLPIVGDIRCIKDFFLCGDDAASIHQGGHVEAAAGEEILVKGSVEGSQAPTEEEAAVILASCEHGRTAVRQVHCDPKIGEGDERQNWLNGRFLPVQPIFFTDSYI